MKQTIFAIITAVTLITACATGGTGNTAPTEQKSPFELVIDKSFENLQPRMEDGKRIALLPINAADKDNGDYAYDTITVMFVNALKYDMVERARINDIIQEHNFQLSGMVSDETAVSIGKFLGANVIIIGDISGSANTQRLVFRALDVETGKILGISSERF